MIPYTDNSAHVTDDFCTQRRIEELKMFIDPVKCRTPILDIGERNYVGSQLETYLGKPVQNTLSCDLNFQVLAPQKGYRTIFCFEVIEHVMNPLLLMENIRDGLKGSGSVCYISTPVHNPLGFFFNESSHFTEYRVSSIQVLCKYAGFYVNRTRLFRSIPMIQGYKHGAGLVRGTMRMLTQQTQIHELVML